MAEFCKECFVEKMLTTAEQADFFLGNLKIIESKDNDFCEGCCKVTPVVLTIEKRK